MTAARKGRISTEMTEQKLVSWKSIAEYFNCDERTAKRWGHERGLPVHRAPGGKRSVVIAYTSELDDWLRTKALEETAGLKTAEEGTGPPPGSSIPPQGSPILLTGDAHAGVNGRHTSEFKFSRSGRLFAWAAACAAVLAIAFAAILTLKGRRAASTSLSPAPSMPVAFEHVPAPGAEELYLRGRYFWNLRTADSLAKSIDFYTQAIVKDPSYAEAYAGLAETYDLLPQFGQANFTDSLTKAKNAADRAIALDPNLAAAHTAKGFAFFYLDWDISDSEAEFKKALALDPNSALNHQWYASTLYDRLDGAECLKQIDEALRLSPTSAAIATDAALFHADFGDFDAGVRDLNEIEETQPSLATPPSFLSALYFAKGDYPNYIRQIRRYASITHNPFDIALADAVAYGWAQGGKTGLLEAMASSMKTAFDHGDEEGFWLGETLVLLGRQKEALPYFRASLNHRYLPLLTMQECPWAKRLAGDPGYAALFAAVRKRMHGDLPTHPSVRFSLSLPE